MLFCFLGEGVPHPVLGVPHQVLAGGLPKGTARGTGAPTAWDSGIPGEDMGAVEALWDGDGVNHSPPPGGGQSESNNFRHPLDAFGNKSTFWQQETDFSFNCETNGYSCLIFAGSISCFRSINP